MMYLLLSVIAVLVVMSLIPIVLSDSIRGEFTVPNWVKNTAGWWASDQIPDSAFLQGIQFLINEGIMIVEIPAEIDSEAAEEIPNWVKNTAGWWAEDKIHDITFVSGIKYLIGKGIIVVEQEPEVEESVEEVVEVRDFYMEVNGGNCCFNWTYVGEEYRFQIETLDEHKGNPIDGVTITVKIISQDGELRHDFGIIETEDGIYSSSIAIPNMDWYAGNILSVTGEYFGFEKTIEKEFEVFRNQSGGSGSGMENSGLKMFIIGITGDDVNEYTLTAVFDVSTASFVDVYDAATASGNGYPSDIEFSSSGKKMFIVGYPDSDGQVNEFTLTTACDVSTASFVDTFSIDNQEKYPKGIAFSNSGKKMFIVGTEGDDVNEYTLDIAWDISSASFVDSFSVSSQETSPTGLTFSSSGKKMFTVGTQDDEVNEYTLATAWDASSASYVNTLSVASQDVDPEGITFSNSGKKMFIVGTDGDDVNEYTLDTAWDISSASFVDSFSVSSQENKPRGIAWC